MSPQKTVAGTHATGAKVFGCYKVVSLNETSIPSTGQPSTTTQFDGINVTLTNAASGTETGGGFQCTCLLYTSPSPRDGLLSRMPSSA